MTAFTMPSRETADPASLDEKDRGPANLPDDFWTARPTLKHIREAAYARGCSADAVFAAVLARTAAMVPHTVHLDFGRGPGSLNLFAAVVGPSGVGKSLACAAAQELIDPPSYLTNPDAFRDGIGLGSGEGLAEAFMGMLTVETGEIKQSGPDKGSPKTKQVRGQVRHNAFMYVDEGETLTRTIERVGTTIGPTLRTAWVGKMLGQANAREETTRLLMAHTYSLGLVIGYQRTTAQPLLSDVGPGTPQRFLWMSAIDPKVPEEPPEHPGKLVVPLTCGYPEKPLSGTIFAEEEIRRELWHRNLARVRGEAEDGDLDSHVPLMRAKLASLLALFDGRLRVTADDWALSLVIWRTSCAVRDGLIEHGREEIARQEEERTARHVEREARVFAARAGVTAQVERIARWLSARIHDAGPSTRGSVKRAARSDDRNFVGPAIEHALVMGWVEPDGDKVLKPGETRPV